MQIPPHPFTSLYTFGDDVFVSRKTFGLKENESECLMH